MNSAADECGWRELNTGRVFSVILKDPKWNTEADVLERMMHFQWTGKVLTKTDPGRSVADDQSR